MGALRPLRAALAAGALAAATLAGSVHPASAEDSYQQLMKFAADMAKRGNWREAKFRWEAAARIPPDSGKVHNNLAVADEALGDVEAARREYERAQQLMPDNPAVEVNCRRAERFWRQVHETGDAESPDYDPNGLIPGQPEGLRASKKQKGKSFKVNVSLPVPARLDLGERKRILVANFLTEESALLDISKELVRFVRSEFRKGTDLDVLDVVPAPEVPEQTLQDMILNHEFWKYLGREYGADVIVSGVMLYDRRDSSGFRDVDVISPTTGQKVRQSQFVEEEKFSYELDLILMDGKSGELLFRDRLQRSAVYRGDQNDPITAFYELCESIGPDLLAIVKPRTREDVRFVFKK